MNVDVGKAAFKTIAIKLMQTFPNTFEDRREDGSRFDTGYTMICRKLEDRYHYVRRPHKQRGKTLDDTLNIPLKRRRLAASMQAGAIPRDPVIVEGEALNDLENIRQKLLRTDCMQIEDDEEKLKELYEDLRLTFDLQRSFLINKIDLPNATKILENWPILLKKKPLFWHFKQLTGKDLEELSQNMDEKINKIIIHGFRRRLLESPFQVSD